MEKTIYNLELHEGLNLNITQYEYQSVIRVAGGWIYESGKRDDNGGMSSTSCFVPFDNEFMKKHITPKQNSMDMPILEVIQKFEVISYCETKGIPFKRLQNHLSELFINEPTITVRQVSKLSEAHLLRLPNFGKKTLATLKKIIKYCENNKL